jgi:hypothetical protein
MDNGVPAAPPGSLKKSMTIRNIFHWRDLYAPGDDPMRGNHFAWSP